MNSGDLVSGEIAPFEYLSDADIWEIAETLPHGPGRDHPSWGLGYRKDASGEYTIPNVPDNIIPFARAILVQGREQISGLVKALQEANFKLHAMQVDYTGPAAQSIYVLRERIGAALRKAGA